MFQIEDLAKWSLQNSACIDGVYVPARPIAFGGWWYRTKDAWAVLTGKADAVRWTGQ